VDGQRVRTDKGLLVFTVLVLLPLSGAGAIEISLPTENDALLRGRPGEFYQFVDRDFRGEKTTPWEGGQYGFVRDPREIGGGLAYARFHEGIDIRPVRRDAAGMPLDEVRACADGRVVYVNLLPGASNYGRYVVLEHAWDGCRYFSLYAHLNTINARSGAEVRRGEKLGVLGFTGSGIDQRRAHLHFELNLMLSSTFESWHARFFPNDINRHGLHNGLNLAGIDVAAFLLARQTTPALTIPEFVRSRPAAYAVRLPIRGLDLLKSYPWLLSGSKAGAESVVVSFDRTALPVNAVPDKQPPDPAGPELVWARPESVPLGLWTHEIISGTAGNAALTSTGLRYMALVVGR
jgi:murein DD-endopeptidase MepM/ murein hydrolase activator NlpD